MNGASVTSGVVFGRETDLNWKIVATGDFNSDGMADLVWQHRTTGQMGVWFMNGAAPKSTTLFTPFQVTDTNWKIVCTGDFNGDNKPDMVWQNQATGNIGVWFMNGAVAVSTTLFSP
ncbi:MAG: VCBS repeat-containing protein, partial [Acidobacteria bacterium]